MRRRYGYYWTKLVGAVAAIAAWIAVFMVIGDTWWQLVMAGVLAVLMTQISFLGHDAAHRQIFKSGRWNDWVSLILANLLVGISYGWWQRKHNRHHANPNKEGADPDIALAAVALTPERAAAPRSRLMRWVVAHQGWYFFPILLLEGLSLHKDAVRRVVEPTPDRAPMDRDWLPDDPPRRPARSRLPHPLPGNSARVPGRRVAVFGLYMGFTSRPITSGCRWSHPG